MGCNRAAPNTLQIGAKLKTGTRFNSNYLFITPMRDYSTCRNVIVCKFPKNVFFLILMFNENLAFSNCGRTFHPAKDPQESHLRKRPTSHVETTQVIHSIFGLVQRSAQGFCSKSTKSNPKTERSNQTSISAAQDIIDVVVHHEAGSSGLWTWQRCDTIVKQWSQCIDRRFPEVCTITTADLAK